MFDFTIITFCTKQKYIFKHYTISLNPHRFIINFFYIVL
jgi:hypothetical protein